MDTIHVMEQYRTFTSQSVNVRVLGQKPCSERHCIIVAKVVTVQLSCFFFCAAQNPDTRCVTKVPVTKILGWSCALVGSDISSQIYRTPMSQSLDCCVMTMVSIQAYFTLF
jgi:hypothetical protein